MNSLTMLAPWLKRFLSEHIISERNLAINTQKSYRDTFVLLLPYLSKQVRKPVERLSIQDMTATRMLEFLHHLEVWRNCSAQTRNQRLAAIRSFARYVSSREPALIEWSVAVRSISIKKVTSEPLPWLTKAEMEALLRVPNLGTAAGRTEHAMILFLYNTGTRASEVAMLRVCDIHFAQPNERHALVTVHGKGGKIRQCPLWPKTEKALSALIQGKPIDDPVFVSRLNKPYTRFGVYRLVERCAAGVPSLSERKVTPHVIRHSCACQLLRSGADLNTIRAWLGHVSLETTNIYAQVDLEMKTKAMEICEVPETCTVPSPRRNAGLMAFLDAL